MRTSICQCISANSISQQLGRHIRGRSCGTFANASKVNSITTLHTEEQLDELRNFYKSVELVGKQIILKSTRQDKLNCKQGCAGCCVDGIAVSSLEAAYILARADRRNIGLPTHPPKAPLVDPSLDKLVREDGGRCAFLGDDNSCQIYNHRPYVCRHFGLPLRWELEPELNMDIRNRANSTISVVRHEGRDICPINDDALIKPVEELNNDQCYPVDDVWDELDQLQTTGSKNGSQGNLRSTEQEAHQQVDQEEEDQQRVLLQDLYCAMVKLP
jgi:Fe-S-cluster containining protein